MTAAKDYPLARRDNSSIGQMLEELSQRPDMRYHVIVCCTREYFANQIIAHDRDEPESSVLRGTLRQLSISERIRLAFCSDMQVLRAYLIALPFVPKTQEAEHIVVVDMLALHFGTPEFTLQGLSQTFAILASTNMLLGGRMELVECCNVDEAEGAIKGSVLWEEQVPLLSGSIKIADVGHGWANQTTSIKSFANRWFTFQ